MWTTVVVPAVALNLEPNRLALIALLLVRPHPIRQLLAASPDSGYGDWGSPDHHYDSCD